MRFGNSAITLVAILAMDPKALRHAAFHSISPGPQKPSKSFILASSVRTATFSASFIAEKRALKGCAGFVVQIRRD
jgi:hypothetical protein